MAVLFLPRLPTYSGNLITPTTYLPTIQGTWYLPGPPLVKPLTIKKKETSRLRLQG